MDPHIEAWRRANALLETKPLVAIDEFKALAERGSFMSMLSLGAWYQGHDGMPADNVESEKWLRRVAETGSARAHHYLAVTLIRTKRDAEAKEALEYAAARGYSPSMVRLAGMYQIGRGGEQNLTKAYQLLERAADRGNVWGQAALARLYLRKYKGFAAKWKGVRLMARAMAGGYSLIWKGQDGHSNLQR